MSVERPALYLRLLHLHNVRPASWHRFVFLEGAISVAAVLVLGDLASAWLLVVLPLVVAGVVKFHDVLAGRLLADHSAGDPPSAAAAGVD